MTDSHAAPAGGRRLVTERGAMNMREAALRYLAGGWHPIEIAPGAKGPPPNGRTGHDGVDMTEDEVLAALWMGNVATRMPVDVIGLDFDNYRGGQATFDLLLIKCGPLPSTVISHSGRNDGSGIRFYRVPVGMHWTSGLAGLDIIQRDHRYAMLPPSMHPDGRVYGAWDQAEGGPVETWPAVDDLPELPWPWIAELSRASGGDMASSVRAVSAEAGGRFLEAHRDEAAATNYVAVIVDHFNDRVDRHFSRHDTMQHCLTWAMESAAAGLVGSVAVVEALGQAWTPRHTDARRGETFNGYRVTEFDAMLRHAIGKAEAKSDDELRSIREKVVGPSFAVGNGHLASTLFTPGVTVGDVRAADHPPEQAEVFKPATFEHPPETWVDVPIEWHATNLLASPTHGEIAGAEKTFKSWTALAIAVGLASGLPVLGRFEVPQRQRVTLFVGEGGRTPFLRRVTAVCAAYGVALGDVADLLTFTMQTMSVTSPRFTESLRAELDSHGPAVVILDPWYAYAGGQTDSAQVTEVGSALEVFGATCREHGATAIVGHHFNRKSEADGLRKITGAGHAEWVDSWLLLSKRVGVVTSGGHHAMRLDVGSRQWGGESYDLDYTVNPLTQAVSWEVSDADSTPVAPINPTTDIILELLRIGRDEGQPLSKTAWIGQVHRRERVAAAAFDLAVDRGQIVTVGSERRGNRTTHLYAVSLTWGGVDGGGD